MKLNYEWRLEKDYPEKKNGLKVFSCFACGGGSTMGYKLAGFKVIGANDIDEKMSKIYKKNHNPDHYYLCDIRELNKKIERKEVSKDLFNIDILDGSPPCSSFSIAGSREKAWGKEKKFREGQAKQVLDDLFFHFLETARLLQPKVIVAENVKGMIMGNAKGYLVKIKEILTTMGYETQVFLLNPATMGVPQKRERVFVIARRKDLNLPKIEMSFNEKPIVFGEVMDKEIIEDKKSEKSVFLKQWKMRKVGDKNFGDICKRVYGKYKSFGRVFLNNSSVCSTIVSGNDYIRFDAYKTISKEELCKIGSFPSDYNFLDIPPKYVIGMSVPPLMTARISNEIFEQCFKNK